MANRLAALRDLPTSVTWTSADGAVERGSFIGFFRSTVTQLGITTQATRDAAATQANRTITSEAASAIAPLIAIEIDHEQRRTLAHGLVGLAEGVSRRLVERGDDFDPDALARLVANLAWAGLRAVGPGSAR